MFGSLCWLGFPEVPTEDAAAVRRPVGHGPERWCPAWRQERAVERDLFDPARSSDRIPEISILYSYIDLDIQVKVHPVANLIDPGYDLH